MDKSLWFYLQVVDWPPLVPAAIAVGLGGLHGPAASPVHGKGRDD